LVLPKQRGPGRRQRPADVDLLTIESLAAYRVQRCPHVGGINKSAKAWMHDSDVVVLQVNFEKCLPVQFVFFFIDALQNVTIR
jgi:hypothetical protein